MDKPDPRATPENPAAGRILRRRGDFTWTGAPDEPYKIAGDHFRDVRRVNLVGMRGEQTAFHMRYFEIAPGGFTSREHHRHEHVVYVVRGEGEILLGDAWYPLYPGDVAYVPPGLTHQLRNDFAEPFGFLCMVDANRDKPIIDDDPNGASPCGG